MITLTYEELYEKKQLVLSLLTEKELEDGALSKVKYAYQKWEKSWFSKADTLKKKYSNELEEAKLKIDVKYGVENKDHIILKNSDGSYQTLKSDEIQKIAELKKVLDDINKRLYNEIIEFEPYFLTDENKINNIDLFIREELKGIFIL